MTTEPPPPAPPPGGFSAEALRAVRLARGRPAPHRLPVLRALAGGPKFTAELATALGLKRQVVLLNTARLASLGMVVTTHVGRFHRHALTDYGRLVAAAAVTPGAGPGAD